MIGSTIRETVHPVCFQITTAAIRSRTFQHFKDNEEKIKTVFGEDDHLALVLLVLPRITQPSRDSPKAKNGKNSLEFAQLWSWLNPLLFPLTLFVAIGDCPVKHCYSSLTGFTGRAAMVRTYLA